MASAGAEGSGSGKPEVCCSGRIILECQRPDLDAELFGIAAFNFRWEPDACYSGRMAGSGTESSRLADEAPKRRWPRQHNAAGLRAQEETVEVHRPDTEPGNSDTMTAVSKRR